jgi:hypothetical protein
MLRVVMFSIVLTGAASAQVGPPADTLLEQIVPESFVLTGTAIAKQSVLFWETTVNYTLVNKTGINLYMGVVRNGSSLGACNDLRNAQGGLPFLPPPGAFLYDAPPPGIFVPASGRVTGRIGIVNCAAPNPGSATAPLAMVVLVGKTNEWKKMIALSVDAQVPIQQIADR